ncbi:MAG: hypothetical protein KDF65_02705 [Anaerolineae bacterium]|nr:hypothetical protein [Anaerolineae bacterium]
MNYSNLLKRAWTIIWGHKFLILLGVIAALGNGGGGGGSGGTRFEADSANGNFDFGGQPFPDFSQAEPYVWAIVAGVIVLIVLGIIIGLIFFALSAIARGGLVAGVNTIERSGVSTFGHAWRAGWARAWSLIGIGLIPAIPVLILLLVGLALGVFALLSGWLQNEPSGPALTGLVVILGGTACLTVPVAIALGLLRTFAERACMLEALGVMAAYRRGWAVLKTNFGAAFILFLIQIAISIGLALVLIGPSIVMVLCCLLWPLLLLIQGTIAAYFSTVWTLAWREWTSLA